MVDKITTYFLDVARILDFTDPKAWLLVCGIALVVGFFCLQGFRR